MGHTIAWAIGKSLSFHGHFSPCVPCGPCKIFYRVVARERGEWLGDGLYAPWSQ